MTTLILEKAVPCVSSSFGLSASLSFSNVLEGEVKEAPDEDEEGAEELEGDEDDKGTTESILFDFNHRLRSLLMERSRNLKARR